MMKRTLATAAVLGLLSAPALAGQCPKDIKAIDAALSGGKVAMANKDMVMSLRNEGEALHKAGKHKESVSTLAKAKKLINNGK